MCDLVEGVGYRNRADFFLDNEEGSCWIRKCLGCSCFCGLGWYYGIVKVPVAVKNELCGYVIQRAADLAFWFAKWILTFLLREKWRGMESV